VGREEGARGRGRKKHIEKQTNWLRKPKPQRIQEPADRKLVHFTEKERGFAPGVPEKERQ